VPALPDSAPTAAAPSPAARLDARLLPQLEARRARQRARLRRRLEGPATVTPVVDGRPMLSFASNDYLGLAAHPQVRSALQRAAAEHGVGAGASHLVTGHHRLHGTLEEELADLTGRPRALLFSTGYMANLAIVASLAGRHAQVLQDRLNHASLLDAAQLARARLRRYPHQDMSRLERLLADAPPGSLVVTDGVFSMEGTRAPLERLATLADRHDAVLVVDDAHGLGVLGAEGAGSLEAANLPPEAVPVLMGTLGKAFGTFGAFVAGSEALVEHLIQAARPYIYTTALPPALAAAALAAVRLARREPARRDHLRALVARFRGGAEALGLPLAGGAHPIQPVILGADASALELSRRLEQDGILAPAIRPPTVPEGAARLRISLSAAHTPAQVDRLLDALARHRP
jgi:8-amino-7-oxononanoate synthase